MSSSLPTTPSEKSENLTPILTPTSSHGDEVTTPILEEAHPPAYAETPSFHQVSEYLPEQSEKGNGYGDSSSLSIRTQHNQGRHSRSSPWLRTSLTIAIALTFAAGTYLTAQTMPSSSSSSNKNDGEPSSSRSIVHATRDYQAPLYGDEPPAYTSSSVPSSPVVPIIPAVGIPERECTVIRSHQSIDGSFDLYGSLKLITTSGSIRANVSPRKDSDHPELSTSTFEASSQSGSVNIRFPQSAYSLPENRTYDSKVTSNSGSIRGSYLLGRTNVFEGKSGQIQIGLFPQLPPSTSSSPSLDVSSGSGRLDIAIHEPSTQEHGDSLRKLRASLTTGSASQEFKVPGNFEGSIEMTSGSGRMSISGKDVVIERDVRGSLVARKGSASAGGRIRMSSGSGSLRLTLGAVGWF
ncbi:hypothetical protein MMC25_008201 [Agyrium rufum]|nr:hypothetical protein [Agyrium rufum]